MTSCIVCFAQCAAQTFFKRFFLKVSVMEVDPKAMMVAALYLAGKVEEEVIEADHLLSTYHKKLSRDELVRHSKLFPCWKGKTSP